MGALLVLFGTLLTRRKEQKRNQPTPLRVLFLSTEKSVRSQMAEVLLRELSHGTIEACSAGSSPAKGVHPLAMGVLEQIGFECGSAIPKPLEHFHRQRFDVVITLWDHFQKVCPVFSGAGKHLAWNFPHPTDVTGSEVEQSRAFEQRSLQLTLRLRLLITLLERERKNQ